MTGLLANTGPASPWRSSERKLLDRLNTIGKIQDFLDALAYSTDPVYRCPRHVMSARRAHCFDGALFAAAALRHLGHPPLIMDLVATRDDDHVIAIYRHRGRFGAVAKSNYTGLRSREPIYRSPRELALSYFEHYYNLEGEKTLRKYSGPFDLQRLDRLVWMTSDENLPELAERLDGARHYPLLQAGQEEELWPVDRRSFAAGILGANEKGIHGIARRYRRGLPKIPK